MSTDQKVLVTAAAGGTGQFVVQLAKMAGNHVIATCGSSDKAALLKRLGADRIINYREESVKEVLKKEYTKVSNLSKGEGAVLLLLEQVCARPGERVGRWSRVGGIFTWSKQI